MTRSDYAARQLTLSMEPDSCWAMVEAVIIGFLFVVSSYLVVTM